jgi:hypothetical protein
VLEAPSAVDVRPDCLDLDGVVDGAAGGEIDKGGELEAGGGGVAIDGDLEIVQVGEEDGGGGAGGGGVGGGGLVAWEGRRDAVLEVFWGREVEGIGEAIRDALAAGGAGELGHGGGDIGGLDERVELAFDLMFWGAPPEADGDEYEEGGEGDVEAGHLFSVPWSLVFGLWLGC